jgi:hypothetical protein
LHLSRSQRSRGQGGQRNLPASALDERQEAPVDGARMDRDKAREAGRDQSLELQDRSIGASMSAALIVREQARFSYSAIFAIHERSSGHATRLRAWSSRVFVSSAPSRNQLFESVVGN